MVSGFAVFCEARAAKLQQVAPQGPCVPVYDLFRDRCVSVQLPADARQSVSDAVMRKLPKFDAQRDTLLCVCADGRCRALGGQEEVGSLLSAGGGYLLWQAGRRAVQGCAARARGGAGTRFAFVRSGGVFHLVGGADAVTVVGAVCAFAEARDMSKLRLRVERAGGRATCVFDFHRSLCEVDGVLSVEDADE